MYILLARVSEISSLSYSCYSVFANSIPSCTNRITIIVDVLWFMAPIYESMKMLNRMRLGGHPCGVAAKVCTRRLLHCCLVQGTTGARSLPVMTLRPEGRRSAIIP